MILHWWRESKAPYEHWTLIQLQPNGHWLFLADVGDDKGRSLRCLKWWARLCINNGGYHQRTSCAPGKYLRARDARHAAENMLLGTGNRPRIKHVTWPAVMHGGWPYAPQVTRGRQLKRAGK